MYDYPQYKEKDRNKVIEFMKQHPFATIIGVNSEGRTELTQVPVLVDNIGDEIIITGHIAKKTTHHKAFTDNGQVLVLFTSPHTYVSGAWYTGNPHQGSTWNYISIHARGKMEFGSEDELVGLLKRLSLHFENGDKSSSTVYDNLPADYKERLIKAIVCFRVKVTEIENVFKLSQNRDEKSYDNIINVLEKRDAGAQYIAEKMKERKSSIF
jgi:transcriptional regulator